MYAKQIKDLHFSESLMSIKTENLMLYFEQTNEYIHNVNSLKHDIQKHLAALHILVKDEKYDKIREYLEEYTNKVSEITQTVYHSDCLVNAAMHYLTHRAESMGVRVKLNLNASPKGISEPDIISLLTNIIDNALEACAKLSNKQESFINLSIKRREPYFIVVCENSNPGGIIEDGARESGVLTSKTKEGHGYGIKIINKIAAAYDGLTDISYDENAFTITVLLKDKL
jgi:sensor histidine kinase regulating citrate/malate metabolism